MALKLTATLIKSGSTFFTPEYVFIATGKNTPSAIMVTLLSSPMPSHKINSGSSAILGIGYSAFTMGEPMRSISAEVPVKSPTARPITLPSTKPRIMRYILAARLAAISPPATIAASALKIPVGEGRNSGETMPARQMSSQIINSTMTERAETHTG